MDVRFIGVHNCCGVPVDQGKPLRKDHKNRLVPLVRLFPYLLVLYRHSHCWINGINRRRPVVAVWSAGVTLARKVTADSSSPRSSESQRNSSGGVLDSGSLMHGLLLGSQFALGTELPQKLRHDF